MRAVDVVVTLASDLYIQWGATVSVAGDDGRAFRVGAVSVAPLQESHYFPGVRASGQVAVFQPDSSVVRADLAMLELARDARVHGADIRTRTRVDYVVVRTGEGDLLARSVVLATGPWIAGLAGQLGLDLPARATLQSPSYLPIAGKHVGHLPTVIDLGVNGHDFYSLPEPGQAIVKGGTHDPGTPVDLDGERDADAAQVAAFVAWATERYADIEPAPVKAYGCIYTWLPDSRFHLARHGRVVVVACCSGRGFKFTPLTGLRAADLVKDVLDQDTSPATVRSNRR